MDFISKVLPLELVSLILLNLPLIDVVKFSQTCHKFTNLIKDDRESSALIDLDNNDEYTHRYYFWKQYSLKFSPPGKIKLFDYALEYIEYQSVAKLFRDINEERAFKGCDQFWSLERCFLECGRSRNYSLFKELKEKYKAQSNEVFITFLKGLAETGVNFEIGLTKAGLTEIGLDEREMYLMESYFKAIQGLDYGQIRMSSEHTSIGDIEQRRQIFIGAALGGFQTHFNELIFSGVHSKRMEDNSYIDYVAAALIAGGHLTKPYQCYDDDDFEDFIKLISIYHKGKDYDLTNLTKLFVSKSANWLSKKYEHSLDFEGYLPYLILNKNNDDLLSNVSTWFKYPLYEYLSREIPGSNEKSRLLEGLGTICYRNFLGTMDNFSSIRQVIIEIFDKITLNEEDNDVIKGKITSLLKVPPNENSILMVFKLASPQEIFDEHLNFSYYPKLWSAELIKDGKLNLDKIFNEYYSTLTEEEKLAPNKIDFNLAPHYSMSYLCPDIIKKVFLTHFKSRVDT